jgi:PAS domain S-box-containing protein
MENGGMFKELVENSDTIVIVTDPSFNIRYVSSAVEKSFDLEPSDLLGRNVFDFVNAERIQQWKQCLLEQNNSVTEEIALTVAKGRKAYFDVHVSNLLDHYNVQGLAVQLHDITERKNRENALVKSNQQMDQVIYKTTHDLKAPLSSALGLVNLAERATVEEKEQYLQLIKKSLLKLDSFIEEMNNFFRNEKLVVQRELIDLKTLLLEELDNLRNFSPGRFINIDFTIEGDGEFFSDSIRVRTIITNILTNAMKYNDPQKKEPFIRIFILLNQEFCQIRIVDNGIGIDEQHQDKIFDLFFRATDQSQGTGIGLFIVRDTIQKLQGTIEVISALDQGSTFLIQIPNQIYRPTGVE